MKIWHVFQTGGIAMYVLFFCSILSVAIMVERGLYFRKRSRVNRIAFMQEIGKLLEKHNFKRALEVSKGVDAPFAQVVHGGLSLHDHSDKEISNSMERTIIMETTKLERFLSIEGTLGSTAVYIGLFGTVLGIIKAFNEIAQTESGGINVVIGGISEALVCTAAGLLVAVPAVIAYNYFTQRVDGFVTDMELCASEIMDILTSRRK